ncbi:MAG: TauD/TfdA dioxygenase family protein [Pseudonocardiaceae bacterium]
MEDLYVTHDRTWWQHEDRAADHPLISHPLVRTHPETGERYLYLNSMLASSIIGMSPEAGDELIKTLGREYTRPEYQVRFHWTPGAIAMWDNRVVQNYTEHDYGDFPRHVDRIFLSDFGQPLVEP